MGFFKSFFSGKPENPEAEKQKTAKKNFEIFKYDGMRAQRMGRADYAIKCFTEALAIEEDFETMGYLAQVYMQAGQTEEAAENQKEHRTGCADRSQRFITDRPADDHRVGEVVELLENVSDQQRQREENQKPDRTALRHVLNHCNTIGKGVKLFFLPE